MFLWKASSENDGERNYPTGSVDSVSLLSLLVNYLLFDLDTSLKQLCCACSLKGIADKTSFEVFRKSMIRRISCKVDLPPCSTSFLLLHSLCSPVLLKQNGENYGKEENELIQI